MEQLSLPTIDVLLFVIAISGAVSWGGVEILKKAVQGMLKFHKLEHEPWWYSSLCRLVSVLLGFIAGFMIGQTMTAALIGFGSGAINSFLVMLIKKYLKKKVDQ